MCKLLTRDDFRNAVFERDGHKCVLCGDPAVDAHHILERRLFADGGYYLYNGASVCGQCHIKCEETTISVENVRDAAGIRKVMLPEHLYYDLRYDKWGNIFLPNGQRLRGELFEDESVQKILKQGKFLDDFTHHIKYPRTFHTPWSPGLHDDDRAHKSMDQFEGKEIVIMDKLDGENTTCYQDHIHARSVNSGGHESRDWVKAFHAQFQGDIPWGWRVNGENMYAKHSIAYDNLDTYFYGFAMWNDKNECLGWDETLEWFELLGITPCPVLYEGIYDYDKVRELEKKMDFVKQEGYVIRTRDGFHYKDFRKYVAKYVRTGHIQTTQHWMRGQAVVPNKLKPEVGSGF